LGFRNQELSAKSQKLTSMSKIGKMPITIENGVSVTLQGRQVQVAGPKGSVSHTLPDGIDVKIEENMVLVNAKNKEDRNIRALFGLTRALLANIMKGVDKGFEKKLELAGVGYRAQMQGTTLVMSLGFSHPVKFTPAADITLSVVDNVITVAGTDKALVGQMAAQIRAARPPEPYKGKGIKYQGERVRRKAGKAAKAAGK
jgi:large subunit ribosomal protein L6